MLRRVAALPRCRVAGDPSLPFWDGVFDLIEAAHAPSPAAEKSVIAPVHTRLEMAAIDAGLSLYGYLHILDGSAVRHALRMHSGAGSEARRGKIAITEDDFHNLPQVVASPDRVVFGTKNRLHKDQIGYVKRMDDGSILYLEEVRTGRRELAAVSIRKYPATMNVDSIVSTLDLNAQGDGGNGVIVVNGAGQNKPGPDTR